MQYKFLLLLIGLSFCSGPEITTVILVRHAEKVSSEADSGLTENGIKRSQKLVELLEAVQIDAIYSTNYKRTLDTGLPLALERGIEIQNYDPRNLEIFANSIVEIHRNQTIVIIGHSNTTPELVNKLISSEKHSNLDEKEYDWIYIADLTELGRGKVKKLKMVIE